jgi:predicted DNA-binding transcriptional regulator YafY
VKTSRVVQILTTLQAVKGYAVNDLANMFGKSRRTIFRDLRELQAICVPYHYNTKTGSYTDDPEFFLPPIDLNLQEALSLLLLVHKARNQIQLPFKNSALRSISARGGAQAPTDLFDKTFTQP